MKVDRRARLRLVLAEMIGIVAAQDHLAASRGESKLRPAGLLMGNRNKKCPGCGHKNKKCSCIGEK